MTTTERLGLKKQGKFEISRNYSVDVNVIKRQEGHKIMRVCNGLSLHDMIKLLKVTLIYVRRQIASKWQSLWSGWVLIDYYRLINYPFSSTLFGRIGPSILLQFVTTR